MAPEQHLALPPTPGVDVWAVGVCLYEMISGTRPFTGSIDEVVNAVTRARSPDLANVPREVADVVAHALMRDPSARFPDAAAMRAALPTAAQPSDPAPAPARTSSRARTFAAATVGTVVAASLLVLGATKLTGDRAKPPLQTQPSAQVVDPSPDDAASVEEPSVVAEPVPVPVPMSPPPASSAPASRPSKGVPCVCTDGWVPLCAEPILSCECRHSGPGMICLSDWPDGKCFGDLHEITSPTDRSGEPCRGWTRSSGGGRTWTTPVEGELRCWNGCSTSDVRDHPTIAVPDTPCRGFVGAKPRVGKWTKLLPPAGR
jgi:serine/threonine protein kinase